MAKTETCEFRTQAGGHYIATHVRNRGRDTWTLELHDDTDANEFMLPEDGPSEFMFVFGMPAVGMQHFNAVVYEDGGERVVNHQSSPVVWVSSDDEEND